MISYEWLTIKKLNIVVWSCGIHCFTISICDSLSQLNYSGIRYCNQWKKEKQVRYIIYARSILR